MIYFAAVLFFTTFVVDTKQETPMDATWNATFLQNRTDCAKENGVELANTFKIWSDPTYPANNQPIKCYYKCITAKLGIIDNGTVYDNADTINFFAHYDNPTELKEIQDDCKNTPPASDECEFAYQVFKCFAESQND